ncbi:DUF935 family protein [Sorangium sp. So ce134]
MPLIDRALSWYAAARGMLAPDAAPGAGAPSVASVLPKIGLADLKKALAPYRKKAPVDPAWEAQRLATLHAEPSVRTYLRWTPADLTAALHQADGGNLRLAADLCEAILGDDRASAVLNTRVNAVLGSELSFEAGRGRSKKSAVKALEAGEDWYAAWSEAVLGQMLLWGRLLGIVPAQQCWAEFEDHGGRLIPVVEPWHARHLRKGPGDSWWVKVSESLEEVHARPGDGKWIFFTPYGTNRPWAHGLWRGFSRLWLLKQFAIDDWGRHSEAHGNPMRLGIPPKIGESNHGNKKLRKELAQDLAELGANSTLVLPPGFDFKLVEATANTWEMFRAQIDMANNAMSVMAIGTNLPTEVGNSAATGATAQNLVRIDYKRADAEALSTMAHDQNLVWWAQFNFGNRGLAPWPLWDVVPPADQKARADVLSTFAGALDKLTEANVPVDIPKLAEEFEVPLREVAESRVQSPRIFEYHLKYGILTKNEIRASLGYDPETGGDVVPEPIVQVPGTKPTAARPEEVEMAAANVAYLDALAEAHNAAHAERHRRTTAAALCAVWQRGASLAGIADRDSWAMGRVAAFLHLLAAGAPEHPAYIADNDLLPEGHERHQRIAALGSPSQPRDYHGRWTDGPGGAPDAPRTAKRSANQIAHEEETRKEIVRSTARAEKLEAKARATEAKAEQKRAAAEEGRARAAEREKARDEARARVDKHKDEIDEAESNLDEARDADAEHRREVDEYHAKRRARSPEDEEDDDDPAPEPPEHPPVRDLEARVATAQREHAAAEKDLAAAEKALDKSEAVAHRLDQTAEDWALKASDARDAVAEERANTQNLREHADLLTRSPDDYRAGVSAKAREAEAEYERAGAIVKERRARTTEAHTEESNAHGDPRIFRDGPERTAAEARIRLAEERARRESEQLEQAERDLGVARNKRDFWDYAARRAEDTVGDELDDVIDYGPVDGDGDGLVNEGDDDE